LLHSICCSLSRWTRKGCRAQTILSISCRLLCLLIMVITGIWKDSILCGVIIHSMRGPWCSFRSINWGNIRFLPLVRINNISTLKQQQIKIMLWQRHHKSQILQESSKHTSLEIWTKLAFHTHNHINIRIACTLLFNLLLMCY
jgi:hypothetical protein